MYILLSILPTLQGKHIHHVVTQLGLHKGEVLVVRHLFAQTAHPESKHINHFITKNRTVPSFNHK